MARHPTIIDLLLTLPGVGEAGETVKAGVEGSKAAEAIGKTEEAAGGSKSLKNEVTDTTSKGEKADDVNCNRGGGFSRQMQPKNDSKKVEYDDESDWSDDEDIKPKKPPQPLGAWGLPKAVKWCKETFKQPKTQTNYLFDTIANSPEIHDLAREFNVEEHGKLPRTYTGSGRLLERPPESTWETGIIQL
ncbi:hypothetical protein EYZ11_003437 [Aspergillus tanneri]|uniref:Uncharacterized protein n=1 Tax=Aspergillus tanneri TaxID=1220188 RepID=A0A4S3JN30_9EURO|nr:uncharacterized protein ATNIH1004_003348 [Aspergillus tanneri]KAA8650660.1 hypothetical protein ATNIH1004_003348 [Aspergillus tanneri]THC97059.1 hypothetical protein EYZ11_003437 [Aspergillus tanneri]